MTDHIMEKSQKSADSKGATFKNLKAKCSGLTMAQIGLAELMTKRVGTLGKIVTEFEDVLFNTANFKNLSYRQVIAFYNMAAKALVRNAEFVQQVTNTTDWGDLEAQLMALTENKAGQVNLEVTRGAEILLTRLNQLKLKDPKNADIPENILTKALNLAEPKDVVD